MNSLVKLMLMSILTAGLMTLTACSSDDELNEVGSPTAMKRAFAKEGKPFTEVNMVYKYDMASFLAYYSKVMTLAGLSRLTGINQQQLSHYVTGRRNPSPKTVAKVENAIHLFAQDLQSVHFI